MFIKFKDQTINVNLIAKVYLKENIIYAKMINDERTHTEKMKFADNQSAKEEYEKINEFLGRNDNLIELQGLVD